MSEIKLKDAEAEFVSDMLAAQPPPEERWHNFDPDFRQADIARLVRRGLFERRTKDGYREYRWTEAGRQALAQITARAVTDAVEREG